ncbi:hypothetical protein FQN54_005560 [Arachnomyces sp. PD_36]|nr:hypothetical protein FQN54_005560 [Arachnomyces sp. PD_36]
MSSSFLPYTFYTIVFDTFRILYMPSVPPFSRSEKLEDYAQRCYPIKWEEQHIKSSDGTRISLINSGDISVGQSSRTDAVEDTHLLILYFQGNAGSLPPRTPYLADTLKTVSRFASKDGPPAKISLTAVSYRGFWTSKGRPSQKGIELDAAAALDWAVKKYSSNPKFRIVIWGASVGSGVSTTAVAAYREIKATNPIIKGLILETPFTNLSTLLQDFYPQRWLPYRYLTPFLRSHWDSKAALQRIAQSRADKRPSLLILQAGNDEVVPSTHGVELEAWCRTLNFDIEKKTIPALHTEIMTKSAGREEIAKYLLKFL